MRVTITEEAALCTDGGCSTLSCPRIVAALGTAFGGGLLLKAPAYLTGPQVFFIVHKLVEFHDHRYCFDRGFAPREVPDGLRSSKLRNVVFILATWAEEMSAA